MIDIDKEIARGVSRVDQLEGDLRKAKARLHDLRCQKVGIKVGDIVRLTKTGVLHRVTKISAESWRTWVHGNPLRKDGIFGTAIRNLYSDWEKVDESHDPQ